MYDQFLIQIHFFFPPKMKWKQFKHFPNPSVPSPHGLLAILFWRKRNFLLCLCSKGSIMCGQLCQGFIPTPPVSFTIYILIFHTLTTVGSKDLEKELTIKYETHVPMKIKSKENSCVTSSLQQDKFPLSFWCSIFLKNQNGLEQARNSTLELPMTSANLQHPKWCKVNCCSSQS